MVRAETRFEHVNHIRVEAPSRHMLLLIVSLTNGKYVPSCAHETEEALDPQSPI